MLTDYPAESAHSEATWLARATASGLCAAAKLNIAGLILALLNLHYAIKTTTGTVYPALGAASLLGVSQLYLMVRIEIDRRLFDALAIAPDAGNLAALDYALTVFGWVSQQQNCRSLQQRSRSAIRFLQSAGALSGLQLLTVWLFVLPG